MKWQMIILFLSVLVCGMGCGRKGKEAVQGRHTEPMAFLYPEIPAIMSDPSERRAYLAVHFWDRYDFRDTVWLRKRDISERGFADFVGLLAQQDELGSWEAGMSAFARKLGEGVEAYRYFTGLAELYLYDANSPARDEELYLVFLDQFLEQPLLDEVVAARLAFQRELVRKNREGTIATDFAYIDAVGRKGRLLETAVGKPLLLIFHDPDCGQCRETMALLKNCEELRREVERGKMAVLAVYTEGIEEIWRQHCNCLPKGWLSVTDHAVIKSELLYDLKAMPTLYLLDKEKRILLKDAPVETVVGYFKSLN